MSQDQVAAPTEPLGGKPPAGSEPSVPDLEYQVKYQRAFEAVLWSMPAVGMYAYWRAAADFGADSNAIFAWSQPATPYLEGVTGNNQTPYILSQTDLSKGPVVVDDPEEAIYPLGHNDADGTPLDGANNYTMTFEAGELPDVDYFWSLTLYDMHNNLVKNPINRWAIGSNSGGYTTADDGSLTLYLQHESPGKEKESNWLPSPTGAYWVAFRTYGPRKSVIDGSWEIPGLIKSN